MDCKYKSKSNGKPYKYLCAVVDKCKLQEIKFHMNIFKISLLFKKRTYDKRNCERKKQKIANSICQY